MNSSRPPIVRVIQQVSEKQDFDSLHRSCASPSLAEKTRKLEDIYLKRNEPITVVELE
jgi:hypothetical protein